MRISIDHSIAKRGFPFRKTYYQVTSAVLFSHEEMQIIRQRGLLKTKLMDRRPAHARIDARDEKFELHLSDITNGKSDQFLCATPSQAKVYEEQLMATLLMVKAWLEDNAELGPGSVTEL